VYAMRLRRTKKTLSGAASLFPAKTRRLCTMRKGPGSSSAPTSRFLRQDFSVVQPVAKPGKWPGNQRYDYFMRKRPLTAIEFKQFTKLQKDKKLPRCSSKKRMCSIRSAP